MRNELPDKDRRTSDRILAENEGLLLGVVATGSFGNSWGASPTSDSLDESETNESGLDTTADIVDLGNK